MSPVSFLGVIVWLGFASIPFVSCSNTRLRRNLQTLPNPESIPADSHAVGSCENVTADLFESTVLIGHNGIPGNITAGEVFALETAFLASYNTLASCEEGYRNIVDVTIDTEINPGLSIRIQNKNENVPFSLIYRVALGCIGCRSNPNLFLEEESANGLKSEERELRGVKGRTTPERSTILTKKQPPTVLKSKLSREIPRSKTKLDTHTAIIMARSEEACFCVAPQESNFIDTFKDTVRQFRLNGVITSIDSVESVTELEEVDCFQDITSFQSSVSVEHTGVPGSVTVQEVTVMQDAFVETYNQLNALNEETCDGLFRIVDSANINVTTSSSNTSSEQEFSSIYQVTGRCRGCDPLTNILVPGSQRSLSRSPSRRLQGALSDICFCPVNSNERPPTEIDFSVALNETIQFLRSSGEIVNVVSTNSARQLTTQPTQAPSSSSPMASPSTSAPSSRVSPTSSPQALPPPTAVPTPLARRTPNPTSAPRLTPNPTSRPRLTPNPTFPPPTPIPTDPTNPEPPTLPPFATLPPPAGTQLPTISMEPSAAPSSSLPPTESLSPSLAPSFSMSPSESLPPSVSFSPSQSPSVSLSPTIPVECSPFESIRNARGAVMLDRVSNSDNSIEFVTLPFTFNWFGDTPTNSVVVSSNGALVVDTSNPDHLCCEAHLIAIGGGSFQELVPRISVAQTDLDPEEQGEIWTMDTGFSFIVSWEDVAFTFEEATLSAQVELFPNGRVDIRWDNGTIPVSSPGIAAGLEDDRRPQAIPATGPPFFADGLALAFPAFQCRTFQDYSLEAPTLTPSRSPLASALPDIKSSEPSSSPTIGAAEQKSTPPVSPGTDASSPTLSPSQAPPTTLPSITAPTTISTDTSSSTISATNIPSKTTTSPPSKPVTLSPSILSVSNEPTKTTSLVRGITSTTAPSIVLHVARTPEIQPDLDTRQPRQHKGSGKTKHHNEKHQRHNIFDSHPPK